MTQEELDKLYEISKTDDLEIISKYKDFYQQFYQFFLENITLESFDVGRKKVLNEKTFKIIEILLNYPQLVEFEYSISNLLDALRRKQEKVCWKISQTKNESLDTLDSLVVELSDYQKMITILKGSEACRNCDGLNKGSINAYKNSKIYIYYMDALTKILIDHYLSIGIEKIQEIMNLIDTEEWIKKVIRENDSLTRDLLLKYVERVLSIKEYVSRESIMEDNVVKAILSGKIKDKKLLKNLILYGKPIKLLSLFQDDIKNMISFIWNLEYADSYFKEELLLMVINKYANEEYFSILLTVFMDDFPLKGEVSFIFNEELKKKLLKFSSNFISANEKPVTFSLENGVKNKDFLCNCMSFSEPAKEIAISRLMDQGIVEKEDFEVTIENEDSDIAKAKKLDFYYLTGRIVDFDVAIHLLYQYIQSRIAISLDGMKAIIQSIITTYMEKSGIPKVGVLFHDSEDVTGYQQNSFISISKQRVETFLDAKNSLGKRFSLFNTMFHEMRHAMKEKNIENNVFDYDTYFILKENIIEAFDRDYYCENYQLVLAEIDARQEGFIGTIDFSRQYFPDIADSIKIIMESQLESYDYSEYSHKICSVSSSKESVNLILDRIISLHPELLQKYPILQLEYTSEGKLKNQNQLEMIDGANEELLTKIRNSRFEDSKVF